MTNDLRKKIDYSIALLRKAEALALRFDPDDGFYLAFSGGKDSQALLPHTILLEYHGKGLERGVKDAVMIADALIAELKKGGEE